MSPTSTSTSLLQNKIAVIFGAGGSVGSAVASEFAAQGVTVFLAGHTLNSIEQVAADIRQNDGIAYSAQVDALDEQAVQAYLDSVAQQTGSIDILLNLTGPQAKEYGNSTNTLELLLEQFLVPLQTLVPSQFITARAAAGNGSSQIGSRSHGGAGLLGSLWVCVSGGKDRRGTRLSILRHWLVAMRYNQALYALRFVRVARFSQVRSSVSCTMSSAS